MSIEVPGPPPGTVAVRPAAPPAAGRAVPPVADFAPVFTTTPAPAGPGAAPQDHPSGADPAGHWATTAVTSLVLTAFAVLIVSGRVVTEGPVLLVLTRTHGVHLGDLGVLAAWCAGVTAPVLRGLRLHRAPGPHQDRR